MGMLDFVPMKEQEIKKKSGILVTLRCDHCSCEFEGQEWMLRSKRDVLCDYCYRASLEEA